MKNEDEKLNKNEQQSESTKSFDNKETNLNWIDTDTYSPSKTVKLSEELVDEINENDNENIVKITFFNHIKQCTTTILNKCRKDNRSLITGFLIVASLSCCITISVINLCYKNLQTSSQRFEVHGETGPSKSFNRHQIPNQNNSSFESYSNEESVNELTDEQTEAIIKYFFQYQQDSSNQNQPF
ncbi:MAG: hypothetical protein II005_08485 [Turicibacter sp.]|nr:hypothetical protein [Turicibacter sp.]MEE1237046.1 hypothetical protein [Turicibacter sp.]